LPVSRSPHELSPLQHYFNHWADKDGNGEAYCRAELDNEIIEDQHRLKVRISPYRMMECVGNLGRDQVDSSTLAIVRGIDIRKTEIHLCEMAEEQNATHVIIDYDVKSHGTSETTVQQSEQLILDHLRRLDSEWQANRPVDENGTFHSCDLTLIDKGWVGYWNEEGELKTWASQPVEKFCMEKGLRRFLPAKGHSPYRSPVPGDDVIIGDHWHMHRGEGKERRCTEVILDADHWHLLVEELFMHQQFPARCF